MEAPSLAELRLELEIGSEPIRGTLAGVPFSGWLELTAALERAHAGSAWIQRSSVDASAPPGEPHAIGRAMW